jgi:AraC-like DNA-binding protein
MQWRCSFVDLTYAFTKVSAIEEPDALHVSYEDLHVPLPEPVRRFALERDTAAALTIWREGLAQPISPVRLRLRLPPPRRPDRFGAAKMCVAQCVELLERREARRGISGRVRDELLLDARRMPPQEEVAGRLCVSVRTLWRQLAEEGTTFRALVDSTRQGLAQELLGTGRLTIEQVADRVGFAEASSFVHAFSRWEGVAPRRWARERAATVTSR